MILIITLTILGFFGIDEYIKTANDKKRNTEPLKIILSIFFGIAITRVILLLIYTIVL